MSESFDPYYKWLAIPPEEQPPHHYRLLGLRLFETDRDVIETASDQRMAHLRRYQTGKFGPQSQVLLNEVAHAKICLMDPKKRARYDDELRQKMAQQSAAASGLAPMAIDDPLAMPDVPPNVYAASPVAPYYPPGAQPPAAAMPRWLVPTLLGVGGVALVSLGALLGLVIMMAANRGGEPVVVQNNPVDAPPSKPDVPDQVTVRPTPPVVEPAPPTPTPTSPTPTSPTPDTPTRPTDPPKPAPTNPTPPTPQNPAPNVPSVPPSNPIAPPATPATPPPIAQQPARQPGKIAPPSPAQQAKFLPKAAESFQKLDELYGNSRRAMVDEILKLTAQANDPVEKFVLLRLALEQAMAGEDAAVVSRVIDNLESGYDFDADDLRAKKLVEFAKSAGSDDAINSFVPLSRQFVDGAMQRGKYDAALEVINAAYALTQRPAANEFRKEVYDHRKEVVRRHEEWSQVERARELLAKSDDDPAANLALGKFLCLEQGDFPAGMARLVKGNDARLKSAAERDLAMPADANVQAMLEAGDAWYDVAQADKTNEPFLARAHHWYSSAKSRATGLDARKVAARLEDIGKVESAMQLLARRTPPAKPDDNVVAKITLPEVKPEPVRPTPAVPQPAPRPTPRPAPQPPPTKPLEATPRTSVPVVASAVQGRPSVELRSTIENIGADALAIEYSPDSSQFAMSDKQGRIVIYNAETVAQVRELKGHEGAVHGLAYSPTVDLLYSTGQDGTLREWNSKGEQSIIANDRHAIRDVAVSPDGSELATVSRNVKLWNAKSRRLEKSAEEDVVPMLRVAYAPTGRAVAAIQGRHHLQLVGTPQDLETLAALNGVDAVSAAWSGDGALFAYATPRTEDMTVVDVKSGKILHKFAMRNSAPTKLVFLADNRTLVTLAPTEILLLDARSGYQWQQIRKASPGFQAFSVAADGKAIVAACGDNCLRVWDIKWEDLVADKPAITEGGWEVAAEFTRDGGSKVDVSVDGRLAVASQGMVTLFDLETARPVLTLPRPRSGVRSVAFSPDGKTLLTSGGQDVSLWDLATSKVIAQTDKAPGSGNIYFMPDGKSVVLGGGKSAARFSVPDLQPLVEYDLGDVQHINSVRLSPNGDIVAVASRVADEWAVRVFDAKTGAAVKNLPGSSLMAISPDGGTFVQGSQIVDFNSGNRVEPKRITVQVRCAGFHPDGELLATGDSKGVVRLWSRKTGQELTVLPEQEGWMGDIHFLPDGKRMLTVAMQGSIRLWKKQ